MDLKEKIANVPLMFVLTTLTIGFVAGWTARGAVLSARGYTNITFDRLHYLERISKKDREDLDDEISSLESTSNLLRSRLLKNRPRGEVKISNISLSPPDHSLLNPNDDIEISFDYSLPPNETSATAAVIPAGNVTARYTQSVSVSGAGHVDRYVTASAPGKINSLQILIDGSDGEEIFSKNISVDYSFR